MNEKKSVPCTDFLDKLTRRTQACAGYLGKLVYSVLEDPRTS